MARRIDPSAAVLRLAHAQAGVVSHSQLVAAGLPPASGKRWKSGWHQLGRGIYCVAPPVWESWCWAGLLRAGAGSTIGGQAAAHLHELSPRPPKQITVWHPGSSALGSFGDATVTVTFRQGERTRRGNLARTTVEEALLDAAAECGEDEIIALTTRALAESRTTPDRLTAALRERVRVSQRSILTLLCDKAAVGIESVLEWRFRQVVILAHGLPEPDRQIRLVVGTRSDCVWSRFGVVAELDGETWHTNVTRDYDKDNRIALTGRLTLHYGWFDTIQRACPVARQVHQALRLGGYDEELRRCRECGRPSQLGVVDGLPSVTPN